MNRISSCSNNPWNVPIINMFLLYDGYENSVALWASLIEQDDQRDS